MSGTAIETLFLDREPCCLEFHPVHTDHFVVGTYHLINDEGSSSNGGDSLQGVQSRDGSIILYRVQDDHLLHAQSLQTPFGVLDVHWQKQGTSSCLGAATSTGSIALYRCEATGCPESGVSPMPEHESVIGCGQQDPRRGLHLSHILTLQVCNDDEVVTAFSWDPFDSESLCCTVSTGEVKTLDMVARVSSLTNDSTMAACRDSVQTIHTHSLEAWTLSYCSDNGGRNGVLSGADDQTLEWTPSDASVEATPPWSNRRIHAAGVTAILPLRGDVIATGSYDDHMRILRLPPAGSMRPEVLDENNVGGGVWRLIPIEQHPQSSTNRACVPTPYRCRVLVCCMYAGACIVDIMQNDKDSWKIEVVARFTEHESMCYGGGVYMPLTGRLQASKTKEESDNIAVPLVRSQAARRAFVTCSFYDKRLCLWRY